MISQSSSDSAEPRLRILVVDDDPLVGPIFSRLLAPLTVTFAQSTAGALARVEAGGKFDAVVCDINMPSMTGMQFYDAIARISPPLAQRMIFVTATPSAPDVTAFIERTGCMCLAKPVRREALKQAIAAAR
jgi:CheY-like chemotaxis protein